jgi:ectoine hydroxylase-related dioxygenase (phytanoyl-CoA dioxygenase family)
MTTAPALAASALREEFEREGFVVARSVIDRGLIEEGRAHVDWLMKKHPGARPEHLGHTLLATDPFWVRLISDPRLLDVAEQFVGSDLALFASHYIAKPPRDGMPVLWHRDGDYWPLEPMRVVTLWLAFDDSDADNGCMRVVPRTQDRASTTRRPRAGVKNVLGAADEVDVDDSLAVDVTLRAGDVSIHDPQLVHGSNANTSERWRRGLTIRYIPTSTLIAKGQPWPSAFLLRGHAVPGVNQYLPRPRYVAGEHLPFRGCEGWTGEVQSPAFRAR